MPSRFRSASIRGRLVLLVLTLWLPAVLGLALQAISAYDMKKASIQDEMEQQALALRFALDAEIDRRHTLARALAALPSLVADDLQAFERIARQVVADSDDAVLLVDRDHQYFYTGAPGRSATARRPGSLFTTSGMGISFVVQGPLSGRPAIAVLVPEPGRVPPRYNVGVPFPPTQIQKIIEQQRLRDGTIMSVIDSQQRVVARSREPERWIGKRASHPKLLAQAGAGLGGFIETMTLDRVASLTYLSPPGRHGWATVVATPEQTLVNAAWQLALRAIVESALLLVVGLGLAILAGRRISGPVRALERSAEDLLAQRVPVALATGFIEVDQVGRVLHEAGLRAREAGEVLEARVKEASDEARRAEANLFEARKHEAIGRLTGAIAHDFNNLLQTISMGLQVVHRSVPQGRHTKPLQSALAAWQSRQWQFSMATGALLHV